jgi:hypothetical protein
MLVLMLVLMLLHRLPACRVMCITQLLCALVCSPQRNGTA